MEKANTNVNTCKYAAIAEELKRRIIEHVYQRKLPPMIELCLEFQVTRRTMTKVLAVLKQGNWVTTSRGGTTVVRGKHPELSRNIALISPTGEEPTVPGLLGHLKELIENNGDSCIIMPPPEVGSQSFRNFGIMPPLAGAIFVGTYSPVLARKLQKHGIALVSANRLPASEKAAWADWDHSAEFTAIVEFLVAAGYRHLAFFQYLYPNLREHWLLIQRDFDRAAREFQLRSPDMEVFVNEHNWDCETFVDFWSNQPKLPEVIVRIGSDADDLLSVLHKRNIQPNKDIKILLAKFPDPANSVWAEAAWQLLQRARAFPFAPPRQIMLEPMREYVWS